ncbi:MAG TPA: DUF2298 domain-containing protein, partial [Kouleothrix sp.]|nr:DUF2298 domain-containing protein [Kouleothrix sp.]
LLALAAVLLNAGALVLLVPLAIGAVAIVVDHLLDTPAAPSLPAPATPTDSDEPYVQLELPLLDAPAPPAQEELPPAPDEPREIARLLGLAWGMFGLLIVLATELVVAKGDIGRMNTVFKFGMQSWTLFALASALALGALWPLALQKRHAPIGWGWRAVAALLVAAALVYPLSATPARLADRIDAGIGPTLDGTAFMRSGNASWAENDQQFDFAEDAAALGWMRQNIAGSPIVLEAHTEAYRWGGRVSIYTGLPTLLGWPWHETQQRQVADVGPILSGRQNTIAQLYGGADPAAALRDLQAYGVEYVYVGKLERALYPAAGLAKFDALAQSGAIEQVYAAGQTRVYRVPRGATAPAVASTTLDTRPPAPAVPQTTLMAVPVYTLPVVGEYAWNKLAQSDGAALVLWLLAFYALLALGLPLAALIFGRMATGRAEAAGDGGWAWARLVGLLLLGYAVWLPASMGLWQYNRWGLLLGLVLVLALDGALLVWAGRRRIAAEKAARAQAADEGEPTA